MYMCPETLFPLHSRSGRYSDSCPIGSRGKRAHHTMSGAELEENGPAQDLAPVEPSDGVMKPTGR